MKIINIISLIFLTVLFSIPAISSTDESSVTTENWEQVTDVEGIKSFVRSVPGIDNKEFKAVAVINAPIEVIAEVLHDLPSFHLWMAKCKEAKLLKRINKDELIYYHETNALWPISNRGTIVKSKTNFDTSTGITEIIFEAIKDDEKYPVKDDVVQVVFLKGKYIIEFVSREITKITYIAISDPAGNISASLGNQEAQHYPFTNLDGLRKMVKLKKYHELGRKSETYDLIESVISSPELMEKMSRQNLNQFVFDPKTVNMIFEDKTIIDKVISEKATLESIKYCIIDSCKKMLSDERIEKANQRKRLGKILAIDNFFNDKLLSKIILKDSEFIDLMLNDKDLMVNILTDKKLLDKFLDSESLAQTITGDKNLIIKMVNDKAFAKVVARKLPECKTKQDFRGVIKQYVDSNKTNS